MFRGLVMYGMLLISSDCCSNCRADGSLAYDDYADYTDNEIDLVPTAISNVEEFLSRISNPFRIFNRPDDQVERNTDRLALSLPPGIRELFDAGKKFTKHGFGNAAGGLNGRRVQAIFPGTRWCGTGDIARNSNDIGIFRVTDTCCKLHDACPDFINAGRDDRGLKNNGIFSRSHCSCDEEFHRCLRRTPSLVAKKIGITYFDVLQPQCFKYEYPIIRCARYSSFPRSKKCLIYELDTNGNKTWQWFDNKDFLNPFEF